jgi:thiamine-phosphate pyrophosphorylase
MDGGARCLQIRAKELPSGAFLDLCDTITGAAAPYDAAVIVNDRPDLAVMSRAAGVHVGQNDIPASRARGLLGGDAVIGLSTHTPAQVEAALREPITYLAVGPVFATRTKDTGYRAVGLEFVSAAVRMAGSLPVVAIGGITLENAPSVIAAGAASVAVIGDLLTVPDVRGRTRAYLQALV